MREHAHNFGPDRALVGIVTEPDRERRRSGAPAVLLANVGMHHRVGPYRLFVDAARRLAELGFTTLRFDLSGLGDSGTYTGGGTDEARWIEDLKSAMGLLQDKHRAQSFVVLGLCSGVDPAHAIALADPRIRGAIFIDGHAFFTRMHYVHRYVLRAAKPRAWELFLKRRVPGLFGVKEEVPFGANLAFARAPMPKARFVRELSRLLEQQIPLLFAFTGEQNHIFSHPDQFHDMVRPLETRGRLDVTIYPRADHTFSMPEDRRAFVNSLARWMAEKFPVSEKASDEKAAPPSEREPSAGAGSNTRIRHVG
jgi:hypothetical protein